MVSQYLICVIVAVLAVGIVKATDPSFYVMDCDASINAIDRAKVTIQPSSANLALYVINDECYTCSKSLVGIFPAIGSSAYCVAFFTPFPWKLYLTPEDEPNTVINEKTYTFGDHGYYSLSVSTTNTVLVVTETKAPDDAMKPLEILIGIIIAVAFLSFALPPLYERYLNSNSKPIENKYSPVLLSAPRDESDISLKQITGEEAKSDDNGVSNALTEALVSPGRPGKPIVATVVATKNEGKGQKPKLPRLKSLDTFRGISLTCMIFVNYGGGGYWFFEHAAWNGLTFADLLFPWFMWIMGVSMAISFHNILPKDTSSSEYAKEYKSVWFKAAQRAVTLFGIGMFLANGYEYTTWRVPGVLQYFACAYGVTSATILIFYRTTKSELKVEETKYEEYLWQRGNTRMAIGDAGSRTTASEWASWLYDTIRPAKILWAYRYEWIIQFVLLFFYLVMHFGVAAPGCPVGYAGPGGLAEEGAHEFCTGGIHRYLDMKLFGYWFIYHHPTCLEIYQCRPYDPEGFLGVWSACTLCYLGLMAGRIVLHTKEHSQRLLYWASSSLVWSLLAGILCGFSKEDGVMPINKNMWTTSFILVTAGLGLVGLSFCYCTIDVVKWWTGAPFIYMGMNSIMIYVGHSILQGYMPFSYMLTNLNHGAQLQMNVFGVLAWILIAFYCYKIKFFVKV
jgi:heparan-alpha-glucosaminide N-acetyltransferase